MSLEFICASQTSSEARKSAVLLRSLSVNALIEGSMGSGKRTLARFISAQAPILDGSDLSVIEDAIKSSDVIIVSHFEKISNYDKLQKMLHEYNTRLIATVNSQVSAELFDKFFSIRIYLAPLTERSEDVKLLVEHFVKEASEIFAHENNVIEIDYKEADISNNIYSLRRWVYLNFLYTSMKKEEIMQVTQKYLYENLGGNNDYRDFLHMFEVPLIKAGLEKFKSQLQLSDRLGLNRNTLRKKIAEAKEYE